MKFLRFIAKFEEEPDIWQPHASKPFSDFLQQQFGISRAHQDPLLALTLSPNTPSETTTELALTQIATHLRSIGVFGRGFGAVMPKWGGLSEIAQVGCRACAVGGGVYVLDKGLDSVDLKESDIETKAETPCALEVKLNGGDTVLAQWLVGSSPDLASSDQNPYKANDLTTSMPGGVSRSISVVSSSLTSLFPSNAEGSPAPAAAVVFFPSGSLRNTDSPNKPEDHAPVYIQVHSSDTGECPAGQSTLLLTVTPLLRFLMMIQNTNTYLHYLQLPC